MKIIFLATLALCALASGAQAQTPPETCRPLLSQGRQPFVDCMREVERLPFLQQYPDLSAAYDQFYSEWSHIAETADREKWDNARYAAEAAKPRIKLVVARQASDARRRSIEDQETARLEHEIAKEEKALRDQKAIGDILSRLASPTRQPQVLTTNCSTALTGLTTCTTR